MNRRHPVFRAARDEGRRFACAIAALLVLTAGARAQPAKDSPAAPSAPDTLKDSLGRDTPRGTVLGFMEAGRRGQDEAASQYLNTPLRGQAAVDLANQLYVVLNRRLPAKLNQLSDRAEGSRANPLKPDEDVVGTINTANGSLDIVVERTNRGGAGAVWLFSRTTLDAVPDVFDEVNLVAVDRHLPGVLSKPRIAGIRLFEWLALCLVVPLCYRLLGWLTGWLYRPLMAVWRRRSGAAAPPIDDHLPGSIRLLLLAIAIRWGSASLALTLLERQFWSMVETLLIIAAIVWQLLLFIEYLEGYANRRLRGSSDGEIASILRLARRVGDLIVVAAGALVALRYFGFDPTAALAGLGIGGIAVALAAQKTLENVIGGLSIIFDKAVRVGDSVKLGEMVGTVDFIGLRSTRIRTLDRTILIVPNGQIAAANVETLSARDKFWFHHFVGLRYETTPAQMRAVLDGIRNLLASRADVDAGSVRVRFVRLGVFSLDIEVFAYLFAAADYARFLEVQQDLLLQVMDVVDRSGTAIAFPSQTLHLEEPGDAAARLTANRQ